MDNANITQEINDLKKSLDDTFLIINGIILTTMQVGFACLEAGSVRSKNTVNILMKNLMDLFICAIIYYLVGYSLAYGEGSSFIGLTYWAGVGLDPSKTAHWFFQFVFAATAATIISGAVAERCNFPAYLIYNPIISGILYPIVSHWVWYDGGWLLKLGFKDFAGSGAVHAYAGMCSFVAAAFLGPRIGRFTNGKVNEMPGHSIPLVAIGGLLLITGFLSFNGGSLGHVSGPGDSVIVSISVVNTIMAGLGGGVVCLAFSRAGILGGSHWPFSITCNAILVGMVSVCSGVDAYSNLAAIVVGGFGCLVYLALRRLVLFCQVDDPLEATAVHLGAGCWGVIAMPFFARGGIIYAGSEASFLQLGYNIIGLLAILAWAGITSLILFGALKYSGYFRVSEEKELEGLDISMHGEICYPSEAWNWHVQCEKHDTNSHTKENPGVYKPKRTDYDNNAFEMEKTSDLRSSVP